MTKLMTNLLWGLIKTVPTVPIALGMSLLSAIATNAAEAIDVQSSTGESALTATGDGDRPLSPSVASNPVGFSPVALSNVKADSLTAKQPSQPVDFPSDIAATATATATATLATTPATTPTGITEFNAEFDAEFNANAPTGSAQELVLDESEQSDESIEPLNQPLTQFTQSTHSSNALNGLIAEEFARTASELPESASEESTPSAIDPGALADEPADTTASPRWRFTFEPYVYVPLHVNGHIDVGNFTTGIGDDTNLTDVDRTIDIDIDTNIQDVVDTIRDTLIFGFMGRTEAWRNHLGIIFDAAYLDLEQDNTTTLNIRQSLRDRIPTEINVETTFTYGQFDLGAGYRFADDSKLATAATDFDLGPVVFDVIGGVRLYTIHTGLDIDTNLGGGREFDRNTTLLSPLLSARLRWNLSDNLALSARGDLAGFGVGSLDLAWSVTTGLDWMFSGNTSFFLGYRVAGIDLSKEVRDRDLDVNLTYHGPYLGMVFRF